MNTVKIGKQVWMAENLNFVTDSSWCYDNDEANCAKYGRMYDRGTAKMACPAGWRLPSYAEWDDLIQAVGGKNVAGRKLKSTSGWRCNSGDCSGTDDFGFSAMPGGWRYVHTGRARLGEKFYNIGQSGGWWDNDGEHRDMMWHDGIGEDGDSDGLSVRCVFN